MNGVKFEGATAGTNGHAVITGINASGVEVNLTGCTFTNLYDAVYCNFISEQNAVANKVTIKGCTFTNVAHAYGVDDGYTTGGRVDKHTFEVDGDYPAPETFAVAEVGKVGYKSLTDALAAVRTMGAITFRKDVELDSMLTLNKPDVVLDLNGHTVQASENFSGADNNSKHLIDVTADGVRIVNGMLKAGAGNNHTLNVWGAKNVTLENLTLDGSEAGVGGAPLIVGASDVTISGTITTITGSNSWYGINVDSRDVNGTKVSSALTVSDGTVLKFEGTNPVGIYMEDSKGAGSEVAFGSGVAVTGNGSVDFKAVFIAENAAGAVVKGAEDAGLVLDEETGAYVPMSKPQIIAGADSVWTKGSKTGLSITSDADFADFIAVYIDDTALTKGTDYTVAEGSTIVTLQPGYLEKLSVGSHAIGIQSKGGTAYTKFTVKEQTQGTTGGQDNGDAQDTNASQSAQTTTKTPETGDTNQFAVWFILMVAAIVALAGTAMYRRNR